MGLILDLLKGTAGENSLSDKTGAWRLALTRAVEALLQGSAGGGVPLGNDPPEPVGTISFPGTSFFASREDHVHAHGDLPGGSLHAIATIATAGFMSATDKAALDALVAGGPFVPVTRTLTAGAGLTGGGDLSADRTFDVVALDTTIDVQANGIRVDPLLVAIILNSVPQTRTLTAGAGLTGGGDLSADRTFDVGQNADASILVNANDIQLNPTLQSKIAASSTIGLSYAMHTNVYMA